MSKSYRSINIAELLDTERFPLLDRTLRHSFVYLFLRLMVEKNLVEKFGIDTTRHEQLGQIISAAYPDENDVEQIRNRIRLTSKKTLINEFNHFEGSHACRDRSGTSGSLYYQRLLWHNGTKSERP